MRERLKPRPTFAEVGGGFVIAQLGQDPVSVK
jgi:hypothetical protein